MVFRGLPRASWKFFFSRFLRERGGDGMLRFSQLLQFGDQYFPSVRVIVMPLARRPDATQELFLHFSRRGPCGTMRAGEEKQTLNPNCNPNCGLVRV